MKQKFYPYFLLISMMVVLVGCKSASKMYQQGNYDEAVELAAKKLQKKPGDAELVGVIQNAYRFAVNDHESHIQALSAGQSEMKYEAIYREYASLQRLYDAIYHSPGVMNVVEPTDYSSYLVTYADKTADAYRDRAYRRMDMGTKESFRDAYFDLEKALGYRRGDLEILEAKEEAFENALTRVVVLPMDDGLNGFRFSSYNMAERYDLDDQILRNLKYNSSNLFVKFYSRAEARGLNIVPDQVVELRLNTLQSGRMRDREERREVSKEIVVKETVYRPDSVVKEYAKVKAVITQHRRTLSADGSLFITVRDGDGRRIWSDQVAGGYDWATEFTTYTGDERALSENDRKLIRIRPENPPSDREMINCVLNDIQAKANNQLRNYFNRF